MNPTENAQGGLSGREMNDVKSCEEMTYGSVPWVQGKVPRSTAMPKTAGKRRGVSFIHHNVWWALVHPFFRPVMPSCVTVGEVYRTEKPRVQHAPVVVPWAGTAPARSPTAGLSLLTRPLGEVARKAKDTGRTGAASRLRGLLSKAAHKTAASRVQGLQGKGACKKKTRPR